MQVSIDQEDDARTAECNGSVTGYAQDVSIFPTARFARGICRHTASTYLIFVKYAFIFLFCRFQFTLQVPLSILCVVIVGMYPKEKVTTHNTCCGRCRGRSTDSNRSIRHVFRKFHLPKQRLHEPAYRRTSSPVWVCILPRLYRQFRRIYTLPSRI